MEEIRDRTFADGEIVQTDGKSFTDCNFENASLAYGGGIHPVFAGCSFVDAGWRFNDAGLRTVQFLQMINNSTGGRGFIDDLFQPGKLITE